jgi:hypothetical protein
MASAAGPIGAMAAKEIIKKKGKTAADNFTKNSYGARQAESQKKKPKQNMYKPE